MKRLFGFLAMAGLMMMALPAERAHALSLINPAASASSGHLSDSLAVEVRHRGRGGFRGGFRGGGRHFGRAHFGRPHFAHRHRPVYHRPYAVRRHAWRHRRHVHPRYSYVQPRLVCRRVWTDFGPRRICRHRPWRI